MLDISRQRHLRILPSSGFTLLEMAIVLLILSLALGGLLISLSSTREINNRTGTNALLDEVAESLYGFAQATGRLPCPATASSNGVEAPVGGGACNQPHGFVPVSTLGLSGAINGDGLLLDLWLSPIRYSVTTANGNAFTTAGGMRATTMANLAPDLRVCDAAACGTTVVDNVPVVLLSLGADWATFDGADVDATANSGEVTIDGYRMPNDTDFVRTQFVEDSFDDLITWLSSSVLFTRMISAGQLP